MSAPDPDLTTQALAWLSAYGDRVMASPTQIAAHGAALVGVILAGIAALMRTMVPLRWLAVGSNIGLLIFGVLHPAPTTALVSLLLLPINLYRAIEIVRLSHRVKKATGATEMAALWLKPYMKPQRLRAGRILFRKGDHANKLFLLTEGELEVVEFGTHIKPGRIFGEIALFSPEHVRTGTVRALSNSTLLWIHESTVRQLYYQNPTFGFHLIELLTTRLSTDVDRSEQRLADAIATGTVQMTVPDRPIPEPDADPPAADNPSTLLPESSWLGPPPPPPPPPPPLAPPPPAAATPP